MHKNVSGQTQAHRGINRGIKAKTKNWSLRRQYIPTTTIHTTRDQQTN